MASVASQLIEEVAAHGQSDSLDAREICADGTYFPNSLRTNLDRMCLCATVNN